MKSVYQLIVLVSVSASLMTSALAANVPVIDLNQPNSAVTPSSSASAPLPPTTTASPADTDLQNRQTLPLQERVRLLEQQISNLTQMNLPGKIDNLQQQIQQLTGQLEVQAHDLQQLTDQQRNFYQDLDQRLNQLGAPLTTAPNKTAESAIKPVDSKLPTTHPSATTTTAAQIDQAEKNVTNNIAPTPLATPMSNSTGHTNAEEKSYQSAFNLLVSKKNDAAISAFESFLQTYPNGTYTPNAHYWLGELYSTTGKDDLAAQQFTTLIQQYPANAKLADAMLKLAIIHDQSGQHFQAQQELQKIVQQFPNSAAARLATLHLQQTKTP